MSPTDPVSDTFQPVEEIDFHGPYCHAQLLLSTPTARIYRISKAGKTMLLKTPVDDSGRTLELLMREYRLGVGLSHPNVAAIYTWESDTPVGAGILMEYVDGRTLADFIAEKPSIKARRRVFDQLLDAVNYIHKHGVTHNDLKPGNILINRANDDVKIIDFGLADTDGETTQRQLGGTAGYSSPELAARAGNADMRSDIYSIGVIMHDIFGERYRNIWHKCMAENPRRRYRNIDVLIKRWRLRRKRPAIYWTIAGSLMLCALVAVGTMKMESLRAQIEHYSQSSQQLADTISTLRHTQVEAGDSIARLNSKLASINREKWVKDSVTNAYLSSARSVIEKYKGIIRRRRCQEEYYCINKQYKAEMLRNDSIFLRKNPVLGPAILDQYGLSTRSSGAEELEKVVHQLPTLMELTKDREEYGRLYPLVLKGEPWELGQ